MSRSSREGGPAAGGKPAARAALADRTPAFAAPGDHPIGRLGAAVERRAQLGVVEVVAGRQERHARIERVRRGDQQRVERLEEIEVGPLEQIAPIGQPRSRASTGAT